MNISGIFIRRPIGTSLLAAGLFVVGMISYFLLGVAALPDMQFPAIFVQASQAGADASTMASTVAAPLERHLGQVAGIDTMRSSSSEGSTSVFMMFENGTNLDAAAREVQAAINAAAPDLPTGLNGSPSYEKANPNDDPIIAFALTSDTQSAADLFNVSDSLLAQRLSRGRQSRKAPPRRYGPAWLRQLIWSAGSIARTAMSRSWSSAPTSAPACAPMRWIPTTPRRCGRRAKRWSARRSEGYCRKTPGARRPGAPT